MGDDTGTARPPWIAVIGDQVEGFAPHDAIEASVGHAARHLEEPSPEVRWIATDQLAAAGADALSGASGIWGAPGGPYRSLPGALDGIRWAREHEVPFLGTCAGFQHGVIEFARHVLGHASAAHAEYGALGAGQPGDPEYFIDELLCSLVGQRMQVELLDHELCDLYGTAHPIERYYCRFGLNPIWRQPLHDAGLRVAGVDRRDGDVRLMRLAGPPCYLLTLFVPQTSSSPTEPHPLIVHYLRTCLAAAAADPSASTAPTDQAK